MPTPRSRNEQSHAPLRSEPSPADIDHPTSFSRSSRASDYVELLIRQTLTPQGKSLTGRPVFNITVQGTYNRTCTFPRIRLKQALKARWQGRSARPVSRRRGPRGTRRCLLYTSDAADEEDSVDL